MSRVSTHRCCETTSPVTHSDHRTTFPDDRPHRSKTTYSESSMAPPKTWLPRRFHNLYISVSTFSAGIHTRLRPIHHRYRPSGPRAQPVPGTCHNSASAGRAIPCSVLRQTCQDGADNPWLILLVLEEKEKGPRVPTSANACPSFQLPHHKCKDVPDADAWDVQPSCPTPSHVRACSVDSSFAVWPCSCQRNE